MRRMIQSIIIIIIINTNHAWKRGKYAQYLVVVGEIVMMFECKQHPGLK